MKTAKSHQIEVPEAPAGAKYPLLYKPRPWSSIFAGASDDARWRGLPDNISKGSLQAIGETTGAIYDRSRVHDIQLKAKRKEQTRRMERKRKAALPEVEEEVERRI